MDYNAENVLVVVGDQVLVEVGFVVDFVEVLEVVSDEF